MTEMTWTCEKCNNQTGNVVRQPAEWPKDAKAARGSVRAAFVCRDCVLHPETADKRKQFARPKKFMKKEQAVELVATAAALAMSQ